MTLHAKLLSADDEQNAFAKPAFDIEQMFDSSAL
jgi:hypothetical protein